MEIRSLSVPRALAMPSCRTRCCPRRAPRPSTRPAARSSAVHTMSRASGSRRRAPPRPLDASGPVRDRSRRRDHLGPPGPRPRAEVMDGSPPNSGRLPGIASEAAAWRLAALAQRSVAPARASRARVDTRSRAGTARASTCVSRSVGASCRPARPHRPGGPCGRAAPPRPAASLRPMTETAERPGRNAGDDRRAVPADRQGLSARGGRDQPGELTRRLVDVDPHDGPVRRLDLALSYRPRERGA